MWSAVGERLDASNEHDIHGLVTPPLENLMTIVFRYTVQFIPQSPPWYLPLPSSSSLLSPFQLLHPYQVRHHHHHLLLRGTTAWFKRLFPLLHGFSKSLFRKAGREDGTLRYRKASTFNSAVCSGCHSPLLRWFSVDPYWISCRTVRQHGHTHTPNGIRTW
jgi:hypothetical protein